MKKQRILSCTLLSLLLCTTSIRAADSWWKVIVNIFVSTEQPQKEDVQPAPQGKPRIIHKPRHSGNGFESIIRDMSNIIDELFATSDKSRQEQKEIEEIKKLTIAKVVKKVTIHGNVTEQEARNIANGYLEGTLASTVAKKGRSIYEQQARAQRNAPAHNPHFLADQAEKELQSQVLKAINFNQRGALAFYVGQALEKQMQQKIARDYKPRAPKHVIHDDGIHEVYPHEKSGRYQSTVEKISQGKVYRKSECCVCMEDFTDIGKRVTLACGHSICPNCLNNWLHRQHKNSCPECRNTIRSDEFPAWYLRQYT